MKHDPEHVANRILSLSNFDVYISTNSVNSQAAKRVLSEIDGPDRYRWHQYSPSTRPKEITDNASCLLPFPVKGARGVICKRSIQNDYGDVVINIIPTDKGAYLNYSLQPMPFRIWDNSLYCVSPPSSNASNAQNLA